MVLRVFVALEVPDAIVDSLVDFQGALSKSGADLKLVERENLHFTIKFLGEIADSLVGDVKSRLAGVSLPGGKVAVTGAGAFPNVANPRVVWAGVPPQDEEKVALIARGVGSRLEGVGERADKPFRAHITLARVRSQRNSRQLGDLLRKEVGHAFGVADLKLLRLKSSVLSASGPKYEDLGVYPLA